MKKKTQEIREYPTREEMYLHEIPRDGIGAELGACKGLNAQHLFHSSRPKAMYLVDLWDQKNFIKHQEPQHWAGDNERLVRKFFEKDSNVHYFKGGTVQWLKSIDDDFLDWVYIDSGHTYDHTKTEIDLCITKVKEGGLIMGHDFFSAPALWGTGVQRAVIERINSRDLEMTAITSERLCSFCCMVKR